MKEIFETMKEKTPLVVVALFLSIFVMTGLSADDYGVETLFEDQTFHFESLRVLGGNSSEILQTIKNIKAGDNNSWYRAWKKTAKRVEKLAESYKFDNVSRGEAYARAHGYYRSAEFFLLHGDPRKPAITAKVYETFYKALDALEVEYINFDIPFDGYTLKATFYPGKEGAEDKPLIVLACGYDSLKEELYFANAKAALERGYSVLTYDGPGQGEVLRKQKVTMTHEWEKPNGAVLDAFIEKFYEPEDIVLIGDSLGGILVTRAAAFDKRISGIINADIFYDFKEATTANFPQEYIDAIFDPNGVSAANKKLFLEIMANDSMTRWGMTHGAWVLGVNPAEPWNVLRAYPPYTVKDIGHLVECDVLLLAGEKDHFVPVELLKKNVDALPNARSMEAIAFDVKSAGHEHCQVGAEGLVHGTIFNWIAKTFPVEED